MLIHVLNYSRKIGDEEIEGYLSNFIDYLEKENVLPYNFIQFVYNDHKIKEDIDVMIDRYGKNGPLLGQHDFQYEINEKFSKKIKCALIGEELATTFPWGDAWGR